MWNQLDLAWAAGFFDGEGHIGCILYKGMRQYPRMQISLTQKDGRPLDRWYKIFPVGNFHTRPGGITDLNIGNFENVQAIMCALWNYLSEPKKEDYVRASLKFRQHHKYVWQYKYRGTKQRMFPVDRKRLA